jgi:hypothetical protein
MMLLSIALQLNIECYDERNQQQLYEYEYHAYDVKEHALGFVWTPYQYDGV